MAVAWQLQGYCDDCMDMRRYCRVDETRAVGAIGSICSFRTDYLNSKKCYSQQCVAQVWLNAWQKSAEVDRGDASWTPAVKHMRAS